MKEILKLMKEYGERHGHNGGVTLEIEDDGSGEIKRWDNGELLLDFYSEEALIQALKS